VRPDYSRYTDSELEDAYSNIDKDSFPERAELLKAELNSRCSRSYGSEYGELKEYTWKSDGRNKFFAFFFVLLVIMSFGDALDGDASSIVILIVSFLFLAIYLSMLHKKTGWVTLNEEGVVYENISGLREIKWFEISGCRIQHMRFTKYATIKLSNGGHEILPVFGEKAEELAQAIVEIAGKKNAFTPDK